MPDISKILIPALDGTPGGIYDIKDTVARNMLAGGINFMIVWDGESIPTVANIPNIVSIIYNGNVYEGTLAVENAESMTFYLVAEGGAVDKFAEYAVAVDPDTHEKRWEKIGYTGENMSNLGMLAYMDVIDITKGLGANVIGENSTLSASPSTVSFSTHTTENVLPSNTTFDTTDPQFGITLNKGKITLSQTTNAALQNSSTSVLSAIDSSNTDKENFLTSSTTFTKKKISTTTIRGVAATAAPTSVDFSQSVQRKLITDTVTPAVSKTINGRELVTASNQQLETTTITGVGGTQTVKGVDTVSTGTLATSSINKVLEVSQNNAQLNEWKDTIANLDIHMYSSVTDGQINGADSETLVISFKTVPTLKISESANYATGKLVGESNAATVVKGVTTTIYSLATADKNATIVATGKTTNSDANGSSVTTDLSYYDVTVAETGMAKRFATGKIAANNTQNNNEQNGDSLYTSIVGTVNVPTINATDTSVLVPSLSTATNVSGDVNVVTDINFDSEEAYSKLAFETSSVLSNSTIQTQPVFSASVTSDNQGDVVIGANINKTSSGAVSVSNSTIPVSAITALGTGTAAAQSISWNNKDLKKVALYDDVKIQTQSHPATRYLNFVTPNGGTISLNKIGSPASNVSLEYSFDGVNWREWSADIETGNRSLQVAAGERMYVRSTSLTTARFSISDSDYYQFVVPDGTSVNGIVESLLCRTPEFGEIGNTGNARCHLTNLFRNCKIIGRPIINSKTLKERSLENTFRNTQTLQEIEIHSLVKGTAALSGWLLSSAASGTIYAPAALTLSENSDSGIPSGWTRSDID